MSTWTKFEDMKVWQDARGLCRQIYGFSGDADHFRDRGLRDQMRRAVVSVLSNIAEGYERESRREFVRFLAIAKGSIGELRSQLYVSKDLGYLGEAPFHDLSTACLNVSRQLAGLIRYLKED